MVFEKAADLCPSKNDSCGRRVPLKNPRVGVTGRWWQTREEEQRDTHLRFDVVFPRGKYPWRTVSSCQVLCLPYVLSMQWCWYSGRVSERQSGFKLRTHTVGSEGAVEVLGATASTIGMLWLTAQQRLVANGMEAKKHQRVQRPWLFHSRGNGRCRRFQPRWVDPKLESVVSASSPHSDHAHAHSPIYKESIYSSVWAILPLREAE